MRKLFVACLAVALFATVGAVASADKAAQDAASPPDYSNDYQVGAAAPAATQIVEDFESGVPAPGWTVTDLVGFGVIWSTNTFYAAPNKTVGTGEAATVDSDEAGLFAYDTEMISPTYDFCGATNAGMNAAMYYNDLIGGPGYDYFEIDYSTDLGATWVNILTWDEDHLDGAVNSLNLSNLDGWPTVNLRFHYYDLRDGAWDWDIQVDDFELTADGVIVEGQGTCDPPGGDGGDGGAVPATSTTGLIVLCALLMIGGSLFVLRRRTA